MKIRHMTLDPTMQGSFSLSDLENTINERAQEYGHPADNFTVIANLWSAYLGINITPYDYCQLMLLAKVGRTRTGEPTTDSERDKVGYAYLGDVVNDS